jgi:lipopolysaccharide export system permease protein
MPVLLYRYLLGDLIPSFGVGLLIFTLILLMDKVMRIVEWIVRKGVPVTDVLKMFGCLLPGFFVLTLPAALLLSVLLTFSRMYGDNELYALKASGVSLYRLLPPVYGLSILVTVFSVFLTGWAGPLSTQAFQSMFYSMATQNLFVGLKEGVFFNALPGLVLYVENVVPEQRQIKGVFISDQTLSKEPVYYFAREGELHANAKEGTVVLVLKDGTIHRTGGSDGGYQLARFEKYRVKVNLGEMLIPRTGKEVRERQMEELTLPELNEAIRKQPYGQEQDRKLRFTYHQRLAMPFGAIVFCALGVPLALLAQRAVRYTGFSLSIVVMLLYFVLMQAGSGLAYSGRVPGALGAWLPNLVLGAMGVYLTWTKAEEKPLKLLEAYAQLVQRTQEAMQRRFRDGA